MTKVSAVLFALGMAGFGCKKTTGSAPIDPGDQQAGGSDVHLDLPQVPEFPKTASNPDGHSVTEMRRSGDKFLSQGGAAPQVVKVKGYVTWKYDCVEFLKKEFQAKAASDGKAMSDTDAQKAAEKEYDVNRQRCDKPHFYIADEPNASFEKSIWVVDVPRNPEGKLEIKMAKEDPASWPPAPVFNIGDQVIVEGEWATRSPKGFINLSGLLVYKGLTDLTAPPPEANNKK